MHQHTCTLKTELKRFYINVVDSLVDEGKIESKQAITVEHESRVAYVICVSHKNFLLPTSLRSNRKQGPRYSSMMPCQTWKKHVQGLWRKNSTSLKWTPYSPDISKYFDPQSKYLDISGPCTLELHVHVIFQELDKYLDPPSNYCTPQLKMVKFIIFIMEPNLMCIIQYCLCRRETTCWSSVVVVR